MAIPHPLSSPDFIPSDNYLFALLNEKFLGEVCAMMKQVRDYFEKLC